MEEEQCGLAAGGRGYSTGSRIWPTVKPYCGLLV